jgi:hypothetical protein
MRESATEFSNFIELWHSLGCVISENTFVAPKTYASIFHSIHIIAVAEGAGTATYTDEVVISNNTYTQDGTNARPVRISDLAADSLIQMRFDSNVFMGTGGGATEFYISQGTHTNTNIQVVGQRHRGLTTSGLLQSVGMGGTATILSGTTSIVVTHGIGITPVNHQITVTALEDPTNTPGLLWISNIAASVFTINCENDPGVSDLDLAWRYHPMY